MKSGHLKKKKKKENSTILHKFSLKSRSGHLTPVVLHVFSLVFSPCSSFIYTFFFIKLSSISLFSKSSPSYLWIVSSCSLTMCASCWNIEPSSTMVLSMFCMVSARLWMYESCGRNTSSWISHRGLR